MISIGTSGKVNVIMKIYIRPMTLVEGQVYLLRERNGSKTYVSPVTFVAYTSCPAVVNFSNGAGQKVRCLREDLFLYANGNDNFHLR